MANVNRREYLTATTLDQAFLDRSQDNLENGLEMVADIESPAGTIHASDRNKYIGGTFYEAITNFPVVKRSLGDWLAPEVEFSRLTITISNVDGRFNNILPAGVNFGGWIGRSIEVKIGLRDVASTYESIFKGQISDIGGAQRDRAKITFIARDKFDKVNVNFPKLALTTTSFPDLESGLVGTIAPVIYGDWTANVSDKGASVPSYPINGANAGVLAGTTAVRALCASEDLPYLDTANVYLRRGELFYKFNVADVSIFSGNRIIDIKQGLSGGTTVVEAAPYLFTTGDVFYVRVKGKDLGAYSDNIIWQARDILKTYGGLVDADFDANWATYRDKSTPAESALTTFKSRVWVQTPESAIKYTLSMLEQVRVEAFVSKDLKFKLTTLHLDEFQAAPSFTVRNWDVAEGSLNPKLDDKNIWNRARADYDFDPVVNENGMATAVYKNPAAITQTGREISKKVVFPNLYEQATVILQLKEMLKLASSYPEMIELTLTPRALKKDLGDFIKLNLQFGSIIYENVPVMIREIGYDPKGIRLPVKLWSFQMTPFPGYSPGYAGIVGGSTATIIEET